MEKERKKCNKCGEEKHTDEFNFRKDQNKHRNECKKCQRERSSDSAKKWYLNNKERKYKKGQEWRLKNRDRVNRDSRKRYALNPELNKRAVKKWYNKNKKRAAESSVKWFKNNPEKLNEYRKRKYEKIKRDSHKKLRLSVSNMVRRVLKSRLISKKGRSSFRDLLPYSAEEVVAHLESLFEPGMSWDNYGRGDGKWHIDHDIPDSWFDYESVDDEGFQKSWALENLQPMWGSENIRKSNKYAGRGEK